MRRGKRKPGIPLEIQRANLDISSFKSRDPEKDKLEYKDFKRVIQTIIDIRRASTPLYLQRRLIIWNINDFMVEKNPTEETFLQILAVWEAWSTRFLDRVTNTDKKIEDYKHQINETKTLALKKFRQLYKK